MALFIQKPVFWNTNRYLAPSGVFGTSGYPKDHGYGHEEWNNSPKLLITSGKDLYRVFHTEGLGHAPLDENAGQTFVFMTASHDGIQQLVGIAGNAVGLSGDQHKQQRVELARQLSLKPLWKDAWQVPNVRNLYGNDQQQFVDDWEKDLHWIPNWICPDDFFWWFDEPVTVDPVAITGKRKLLGMYSRYTALDLPTVTRLLSQIPLRQRQQSKGKWERLIDAIQTAPAEPLPASEMLNGTEPVTTALAKINARRGQGKFRADLLRVWEGACAVTGMNCSEVLRASHVKPWAKSTDKQRLDSNNGLLLSANLDALFDKGLITFKDNGEMLISSRLEAKHHKDLGLPQALRFVPKELTPYLKHHRENEFLV